MVAVGDLPQRRNFNFGCLARRERRGGGFKDNSAIMLRSSSAMIMPR